VDDAMIYHPTTQQIVKMNRIAVDDRWLGNIDHLASVGCYCRPIRIATDSVSYADVLKHRALNA
jgi:hypothetical protein